MNRYADTGSAHHAHATTTRYAVPRAALLAATGLLAATTLLAGCGNDTAASPATGLPVSPATVTIPTAQQNTSTGDSTTAATSGGFDVLANMPDAAKQHTNTGVQAFARYYIEAVGRLLMNPVKGQLPKLYLPECTGCADHERIIGENVDANRRYSDVLFKTRDVGVPEANGKTVDASQVTDIHLISLVRTSGVVVTVPASATPRSGGAELLVEWRLSWHEGQWLVGSFSGNNYTPPTS